MDLKDVIAKVEVATAEAGLAYNAGHPDVAGNYLCEIAKVINEYFGVPATPLEDVTKSATSEKPEEPSKEKPEQAAGAQVPKKGVVPFAASQKSALDQAGP